MTITRESCMQIESIVIVGGGSSGWMSAALLSKSFPEMEIALIESPTKPPIGVGESTLGHFNRFLRRMELEDKDWMPKCNATYKTSIAFKNFRKGEGERFQYPFGGLEEKPIDYYELQCQYGKEEYPAEGYANYVNTNTWLADTCKIAEEIPDSNFNFRDDTAYHLDADLFGQYLRDYHCVPNGVVHLKGDIQNVIKRPDGSVESIMTTDGGILSADLFIDCTGFQSLLLEKHMGSEFIPFDDYLFNDRALAAQVPYINRQEDMETYTDCVAMNAGWVWNIPLWHRIGTGYVYSSKYISDEEAEREYREWLSDRYSPEIAQTAHLRPIRIRHGKRKEAWVKNVIGIGLSYGFLEPLESTGLMTTHENLIYLVDTIARRDRYVNRWDIHAYNTKVNNIIEVMKNFVSLHYAMSERSDTRYWEDCTNNIVFEIDPYTSDSTRSALHGAIAIMTKPEDSYANPTELDGLLYIVSGLGFRPITEDLYKEKIREHPEQEARVISNHEKYQEHKKSVLEWVDQQPSHYQYLLENIYGTDEYVRKEEVD